MAQFSIVGNRGEIYLTPTKKALLLLYFSWKIQNRVYKVGERIEE